MPENSVFYIDDVTLPVSWYNVSRRNNRVYVMVQSTQGSQTTTYKGDFSLPKSNYHIVSLANGICTLLSARMAAQGIPNSNTTVLVDTPTNTFTLEPPPNAKFTLLPDDSIEEFKANGEYTSAPYRSLNEVLGNNVYKPFNTQGSWTSGYVNFHSIRNIYMRSSNLGTYSTMSLRGDRDIVKKIPVSANANEVIFNTVMVAQDYLDCSRHTLSRLRFKLEDVD